MEEGVTADIIGSGSEECCEGSGSLTPDVQSFRAQVSRSFGCRQVDLRTYSPLTLAYIGDAVYDLIIRTVVVERSNRPANKLHHETVRFVSAVAQSRFIDSVEAELTHEEEAVYHRGRNATSYTSAKNATIVEYRKATGMEALYGYLYLEDRLDRILELTGMMLDRCDMKL